MVGLRVVRRPLGRIVSRLGLGERVDRARVEHHLVVDMGGVELILERQHRGARNVGVQGSVEDEHLRLDVLRVLRRRGVEAPVKRHHGSDVGARAGELQSGAAPEAEADGRHPIGGDVGLGSQGGEGSLGTRPEQGPIVLELARLGASVLRVRGANALAVDVGGKGHVPQLRQLLGLLPLVSGDPHPLVEDQDPRLLRRAGGVVGEVPLEHRVPLLVVDGLRDDLGTGGGGGDGEDERKQGTEVGHFASITAGGPARMVASRMPVRVMGKGCMNLAGAASMKSSRKSSRARGPRGGPHGGSAHRKGEGAFSLKASQRALLSARAVADPPVAQSPPRIASSRLSRSRRGLLMGHPARRVKASSRAACTLPRQACTAVTAL